MCLRCGVWRVACGVWRRWVHLLLQRRRRRNRRERPPWHTRPRATQKSSGARAECRSFHVQMRAHKRWLLSFNTKTIGL
jgi:hypothetical protein